MIGMETIGKSFFPSIYNTMMVDKLKHNLLSISKLCGSDYEVVFDKTNSRVINPYDKSIFFT
jgi:hypothetical protein